MTVARAIRPKIEEALSDTPVILLHGARQVGKTTLVRSFTNYEYFTLDNATTRALAQTDPTGFIQGLPKNSIIDEIQLVPELMPAIKERIDNNRQAGTFLLTGSANVLLIPKASESLAGRMEILTLAPLSQSEIANTNNTFIDNLFNNKTIVHNGAINKADLTKRMLQGGYPEARTRNEKRRQAWFEAYITTILTRDVRDLANIEGIAQLPRLLALIAARNSNLLNLSDIANNANIAYTTLNRYMALLEATFLIRLVQPWSGNFTNRLVKSPKVYLIDTALITALLGINQTNLELNPLYGNLLENFIVSELHKLASWSDTNPKAYHFRTQAQQEVDVILESTNGQLLALEIKASATVTPSDFKGLKTLQAQTSDRFVHGAVLYTGDKIIPFGERLSAIPLTALWA